MLLRRVILVALAAQRPQLPHAEAQHRAEYEDQLEQDKERRIHDRAWLSPGSMLTHRAEMQAGLLREAHSASPSLPAARLQHGTIAREVTVLPPLQTLEEVHEPRHPLLDALPA